MASSDWVIDRACLSPGLTNSLDGLEQELHLNQQRLQGGADDAAETTGSNRGRL